MLLRHCFMMNLNRNCSDDLHDRDIDETLLEFMVCSLMTGIPQESAKKSILAEVFDHIELVDVLDSKDELNLALLSRPDLGVTFTKLHCWRLTQYTKAVFLDADTLVIQNIDDLFEREELSAAPDPGWPDCFNTGVFVFTPNLEQYRKLLEFALEHGSFDGGDQGLLNMFFSDWATKDIRKHLPFLYNCISQAFYSYPPAMKRFRSRVRVVHFIGPVKPWHQNINPETGTIIAQDQISQQSIDFLNFWWQIFISHVKPKLNPDLGGPVGHLAGLHFATGPVTQLPKLPEVALDRQSSWERGEIDYTGADRFSNIQAALDKQLSK